MCESRNLPPPLVIPVVIPDRRVAWETLSGPLVPVGVTLYKLIHLPPFPFSSDIFIQLLFRHLLFIRVP